MVELRNTAAAKQHLSDEILSLSRFGHLLGTLVRRDLTVRYKRSVLGVLWTMLNPLAMMVVLTIVFSRFFRFEIQHYETYFLSQYLGWIFFSQTTANAIASLAWNGPLMKRVRIPKSIFALAATFSGIVNLVVSLLVLGAIMLVVRVPIHLAVVFLPVSVLVLALFTLGVALGASAIAVHFTDFREMFQIGLMLLMYLTPIIYPISIVPERYRVIIDWNPLTHLLVLFRDPIYFGRLPQMTSVVIACSAALVSLLAGWLVFRRLSTKFHIYM